MIRLVPFLFLGLAAAQAATIDFGFVSTLPYFVSDGTTVIADFTSTDGQFSLSGSGLLGGANLGCVFTDLGCPFHQAYSIEAFFPDFSSYPALGFVTIDGNSMGPVFLACPADECPHTSLRLTTQPFDILALGDYQVPFSVSGQIQAAQSPGSPLILDQTVTGVGLVHFHVVETTSGQFSINPSLEGGQLGLRWVFQPVPEPSMFLPILLGLAAIQWRRRRVTSGL